MDFDILSVTMTIRKSSYFRFVMHVGSLNEDDDQGFGTSWSTWLSLVPIILPSRLDAYFQSIGITGGTSMHRLVLIIYLCSGVP